MSQLRAPRIAGVGGGVGTTTLATALRGYDRGRAAEQGVDVLVCRSTGESLHQAATMIAALVAAGRPRPVLAVTSDQPSPIRGPLRARLRMIEPQVNALIVLPYVGHWRELTDPLSEVAGLAEAPIETLPKQLRGYAGALGALAEAVLRSGLLRGARGAGGPPTTPPANRATWPINGVNSTGPIRTTDTSSNMITTRACGNAVQRVLDNPFARVAASGGAR